MRLRQFFFCILFFFVSKVVFSQLHAPNIDVEINQGSSIGGGLSYGFIWKRDAYFVGATFDYSKLLNDKFVFISSLTFDQETETLKSSKKDVVNTFSFVLGASYLLFDNWSLTTGFAKGVIDDSNSRKVLKFSDGDLGTGLVVGYRLPSFFRNKNIGLSISSALEYNISSVEFSTSFDLGFAYSF